MPKQPYVIFTIMRNLSSALHNQNKAVTLGLGKRFSFGETSKNQNCVEKKLYRFFGKSHRAKKPKGLYAEFKHSASTIWFENSDKKLHSAPKKPKGELLSPFNFCKYEESLIRRRGEIFLAQSALFEKN